MSDNGLKIAIHLTHSSKMCDNALEIAIHVKHSLKTHYHIFWNCVSHELRFLTKVLSDPKGSPKSPNSTDTHRLQEATIPISRKKSVCVAEQLQEIGRWRKRRYPGYLAVCSQIDHMYKIGHISHVSHPVMLKNDIIIF